MRAVFLLALLVALPDRPDMTPREKPRSPHEALIGDWAYISSTADGNGVSNLQSIWRVTPTEAFWLAGGSPMNDNSLTARYTIDWTASPVTIDLQPKQHKGKMLGIVRIEGDRMVMAMSLSDGNRPTDFFNAPWVHSFRRVKR
jgi:uncharacterized protein (TIGR03067 family)